MTGRLLCFILIGSPCPACGRRWCRNPWRSERWLTAQRRHYQRRERQKWTEGSSKYWSRIAAASFKIQPNTISCEPNDPECFANTLQNSYLFVFHMWIVSGSVMLCCAAWSSNKSKKYLTARGTGRLVLKITVNKSSTNFCSVPYKHIEREIQRLWFDIKGVHSPGH